MEGKKIQFVKREVNEEDKEGSKDKGVREVKEKKIEFDTNASIDMPLSTLEVNPLLRLNFKKR